MLQKAELLASTLCGLGGKKGVRVVLCMQNCPQLVIAHFDVLRANAVVVPVNPMNRSEALKHYITDPDAKVAITTSDLATELACRLISHYKVTHWTNIPTMVIDLLASPRFDTFDLTETAAPSHSNPPDAPKQQRLGIPFMGVDARVVDPDTLAEMPTGEQGEIVMAGPQIFQGYWKRPDATEAAFVQIDGKRFFRSGDLGHVDADGYFFLTDRLKRMINASGFKVWPAEVEALMFRHPAVQAACIISTKDAYRGESVKAVVERRASHAHVTEQDLMDWCHA